MSDLDEQAAQIGRILREKYNMQPAAIPEANKFTGIMEVPYIPPPVFSDISLKDVGRQTLSL